MKEPALFSTKKAVAAYICIFVLIAVAGIALTWAYHYYYDRKVPNFEGVSEIYVRPDTPVDSVMAMVLENCSPKKAASVRRVFKDVATVKPGHYTVTAENPSIYVGRMLSNGWQTPVKLVLSGSLRKQSVLASKISSQMMLDSADVIAAIRDSALLAGFGFTTENVFALFVPDTYECYWTEDMEHVLQRQKAAYDAFWTDANKEKAKAQGLTMEEVSVLASIVNGETLHEPEMPCIAGVYLNRLRTGMKLQADPTVAFCFDYSLNRILKKHLTVDSPYNTYKNFGLPPAPICVPTKPALEAVLNPDTHGYLYFCASPDFNGTHRFATTYMRHLQNAREFQRALTVRQREKAAAK